MQICQNERSHAQKTSLEPKSRQQHGVQFCGCMLGTNIADFSTDDPEIASLLRSYLQQVEDAFTATLSAAQAMGELTPNANPRRLARLLLCTTQGMALLGRVMEDETTLEGAVEAAITLLENS